jgi:hypothetical protein
MKFTLPLMLGALVFGAGGCKPKNVWLTTQSQTFMAECTPAAGERSCKCQLNNARALFTADEYQEIELARKAPDGRALKPSEIQKLVAMVGDCNDYSASRIDRSPDPQT